MGTPLRTTTRCIQPTAERQQKSPSAPGGEELPHPRHTLQLVGTAVVEVHARTRDEIDDCPRHEDVAGCRECADSGTDVHGDAGNVVAALLDLAGVDADPNPPLTFLLGARLLSVPVRVGEVHAQAGRFLAVGSSDRLARFHIHHEQPLVLPQLGQA